MSDNKNDIRAVDAAGIDSLVNVLEEHVLQISMAFDDMNDIIDGLSSFVKSDLLTLINDLYANISANYPNIKDNLETHKTDFIVVKNNHIDFEKNYKVNDVVSLNEEGGDYTGVRRY